MYRSRIPLISFNEAETFLKLFDYLILRGDALFFHFFSLALVMREGGEERGKGGGEGWCVMGGEEMGKLIGEGRRVGGETPFSFRRLLFSCLLNDGLLVLIN